MRTGRPYMSIGEVLAALKPEFPDASVSKIRFLEGAGLIVPERTASGYRMFYQLDLDRLRAILKMQRDSFLPLKVIRERLAAADAAGIPAAGIDQSPISTLSAASNGPAAPRAEQPPVEPDAEDELVAAGPALHLTESDLADAAGLDLGQVKALREFGVICEHSMNGGAYFDADDLDIGRIARDLLKLGIDPRHMKSLRRSAEQEAGLFQQLVTPTLRTRRPEARQQAIETVTELAKLSRKLRLAYLKQSLRATLAGEG